MATTVQVKPLALKNIGNVPDWVNKQRAKDKKDALKPARRSTPKPKAVVVPQVAPAVAKPPVVPQPITEEVKDPIENGVQDPHAGSKVRRIYSREFLIKFRYSAAPFPPGAVTPQDIIDQYNKDYELRERLAQENSRATASTPSATVASHPEQAIQSTEVSRAAPAAEKKIKKKIEGDKKAFKLRGLESTDESILRSPLFRASTNKVQAGSKRSSSPFTNSDDKENPTVSSKAAKSASDAKLKRRATSPLVTKSELTKTQKLPTTSSSLIPAVVSVPAIPVVIPTPAPAITPVIATPVAAPTPIPTPAPEPTQMETTETVATEASSQDAVDALTKKLKAVLKETDARRLAQRQKQIEYGKATPGYKDYVTEIAKSKRKREDPKTPNKYQVCSKRSWDGQIRKWRRMLHFYDPADLKDSQAALEAELDKPSMEITDADILAEENALRE